MKSLAAIAAVLLLALTPTAAGAGATEDPETGLAAQCKALQAADAEELARWLAERNGKSLAWARGIVATGTLVACAA